MSPQTADLVDAHAASLRSCNAQLHSYGGRTRFHGPVRTIQCFEDNLLIKQALASPGNGAVLVSRTRRAAGDAALSRLRPLSFLSPHPLPAVQFSPS